MVAEFPGEDTHLCNACLYGFSFGQAQLCRRWSLSVWILKSGESWLMSMILEIILTIEHPNATGGFA